MRAIVARRWVARLALSGSEVGDVVALDDDFRTAVDLDDERDARREAAKDSPHRREAVAHQVEPFFDAEEHVALLIPGWRHTKTGRLHIRRDCRAVQFGAKTMNPELLRFDTLEDLDAGIACEKNLCGYCFDY